MLVFIIIFVMGLIIWSSVQSNMPNYDYSSDSYLWDTIDEKIKQPTYVDDLLKVQVIPNDNAQVCNQSEIEDEMDTWI